MELVRARSMHSATHAALRRIAGSSDQGANAVTSYGLLRIDVRFCFVCCPAFSAHFFRVVPQAATNMPPPRDSLLVVSDPSARVVYLIGGSSSGSSTSFGDVWRASFGSILQSL